MTPIFPTFGPLLALVVWYVGLVMVPRWFRERPYRCAYPRLKCDFCGTKSDEVIVYRQRTRYVEEEDNWVAACPPCQERNDEYWCEMWDYYNSCM
jgi:hypothetical protein